MPVKPLFRIAAWNSRDRIRPAAQNVIQTAVWSGAPRAWALPAFAAGTGICSLGWPWVDAGTLGRKPPTPEMQPQVVEGKAKLFMLADRPVFYNETQIFNRDYSMLGAQTFLRHRLSRDAVFQKEARVLDALSASGLRALRYAQELDEAFEHKDVMRPEDRANKDTESFKQRTVSVKTVVLANDISEDAVATIRNNAENQGQPINIVLSQGDANLVMRQQPNSLSVVDLDPYGHPSIFVDAALEGLENVGLLAATATDGLVTCGRQPGECLVRYQSLPADAVFCHEFSVRMVIGQILMSCVRKRIGMRVLSSFYHAHYLRVFIQINKQDKKGASELLSSLARYQYCKRCCYSCIADIMGEQKVIKVPPACPLCSQPLFWAGPVYTGPLGEEEFIDQMLAEMQREDTRLKLTQQKLIGAQLNYLRAELQARPLFIDLPQLGSVTHTPCINNNMFVNYCKSLGHTALPTSFLASGIKTALPDKDLLAIMKFWHNLMLKCGKAKKDWPEGAGIAQIQVKRADVVQLAQSIGRKEDADKVADEMAAQGWVDDASTLDVSCSLKDPLWKSLRELGLFQANPAPNWGPKKAK